MEEGLLLYRVGREAGDIAIDERVEAPIPVLSRPAEAALTWLDHAAALAGEATHPTGPEALVEEGLTDRGCSLLRAHHTLAWAPARDIS